MYNFFIITVVIVLVYSLIQGFLPDGLTAYIRANWFALLVISALGLGLFENRQVVQNTFSTGQLPK